MRLNGGWVARYSAELKIKIWPSGARLFKDNKMRNIP